MGELKIAIQVKASKARKEAQVSEEYQPTPAQRQIMDKMTCLPEMPKVIASRMFSNITRQNVSMQLRIMADNDVIKRHGRGKFSLKRERQSTLKAFFDDDCVRPADFQPKKLAKKQRGATTLDRFAEEYPGHLEWLIYASTTGNKFAASLLSQLRDGFMLTLKQMAAVEKNFPPHSIYAAEELKRCLSLAC